MWVQVPPSALTGYSVEEARGVWDAEVAGSNPAIPTTRVWRKGRRYGLKNR